MRAWVDSCLSHSAERHTIGDVLTPYPGKAFTVFGDETVNPRGDNGQRYRAELKHGMVERADIEFRSERFLRLFAGTRVREQAAVRRREVTK